MRDQKKPEEQALEDERCHYKTVRKDGLTAAADLAGGQVKNEMASGGYPRSESSRTSSQACPNHNLRQVLCVGAPSADTPTDCNGVARHRE
jgi:hypothetical protein